MPKIDQKTSHEIAIERILSAAASGATELDLSAIGAAALGEPGELSELPEELWQLKHLTVLRLSLNQLTAISPRIGELTRLTLLDLSFNQLAALPVEIERLTHLAWLDLSNNKLSSFPLGLWALPHLQSLNLSDLPIGHLPGETGQLVNLQELLLENCALKTIPLEIRKLKKLRVLSLFNNHLQTLPGGFSQLSGLEELALNLNPLAELPQGFEKLSNLQALDLSDCAISLFPGAICQLRQLKTLRLMGNQLQTIPPEIGNLPGLVALDVSFNALTDLPKEIGALDSLVELDISGNAFEALPQGIFELSNLEALIANQNLIAFLPQEISCLHKLRVLSLGTNGKGPQYQEVKARYTNQITELPRSIKELHRLQVLDLTGNPLPVPEEILARVTEPKAIIDYYWTIQFLGVAKQPMCEAKILFVGQGGVGKTSLVLRLLSGQFNPGENKTDGIAIHHGQVINLFEGERAFRINIWDFGGQEIMHATHQFFLTKRSLYVLVVDARLSQEENRVEYWLKTIQSFGGDSPVLIVGNKIDQHPLDIDRTGLQNKYTNLAGILETSAATGAGIEALQAAITSQVNHLAHIRDLLPEAWFKVKARLESLGQSQNFVSYDRYLDLCEANGIGDETSQRMLIGFLHDLGVVLHFQDEARLEALGILNPQWVTQGVYKILNAVELFQNQGLLTVAMLGRILHAPEYPRSKRLFIVDMMKKFELCYDVEPDKSFLLPDLLPKDEPTLEFSGTPAFEYLYPVLPASVIARFIVRMNAKIFQRQAWRTGVVLQIGRNRALVKADSEDRTVRIAIDGPEHTRRDVLAAIRYQLDEIHASMKGLNPQRRVPIPAAPNADPLEYEYLLMLEREGLETLPVKDGTRLVKVDVCELLSGVESEAQRKENGARVTNIFITGDVSRSNIIAGDENRIQQETQGK